MGSSPTPSPSTPTLGAPELRDEAPGSHRTPEDTPDYRERLAYGTDQGRWLLEEMARPATGDAKRRQRPTAQRCYHELDDGGAANGDLITRRSRPGTPPAGSKTQVTVPRGLFASVALIFALVFILLRFT